MACMACCIISATLIGVGVGGAGASELEQAAASTDRANSATPINPSLNFNIAPPFRLSSLYFDLLSDLYREFL